MDKKVSRIERKEITKERLIKGVGTVLAKDGFKGLGVNKVAKEAGVDKVLVYRYFGGLPGVIREFSRTIDFWPTVDELIGSDFNRISRLSPDMQVSEFFKSFMAALRQRPLTLDIMAWEMLERNELTKLLEDIRIRTILEYFDRFDEIPDDDVLSAIVVLMGGAVVHLLVQSRIRKSVGGIDLESEEGWIRFNQAMDRLLKGIFKG